MVLVCHPSHRLARRRVAQAADLQGERFVAFDHDLPIRRAIDRVLRQAGVRVEVVMQFDNIETIKQAIAIAAGVSILPRPAVAKEVGIRMLGAVPLAIGGLVRPIAIIHRKGKRLPPAVDRFIDLLRKAGNRRGSKRQGGGHPAVTHGPAGVRWKGQRYPAGRSITLRCRERLGTMCAVCSGAGDALSPSARRPSRRPVRELHPTQGD